MHGHLNVKNAIENKAVILSKLYGASWLRITHDYEYLAVLILKYLLLQCTLNETLNFSPRIIKWWIFSDAFYEITQRRTPKCLTFPSNNPDLKMRYRFPNINSVYSESWRFSVLRFTMIRWWIRREMCCKLCLHNLQFGFSVVFVTKPLCNSSITENVCRIIECHVSISVVHDVIVTWHVPPDSTLNCGGLPRYKLFTIIIRYIADIHFLIVMYIYIWWLFEMVC